MKTKRSGIEYGIGAIPLGGFVSIPGMHRPVPHDAERRFDAAVQEDPGLAGPVDRVKRSLVGDDLGASLATLDELEQELNARRLSPVSTKSAEKGLTELRDGLGPDAYWKAATWKRLVAIGAGPGANILLAIVLFAVLFMTGAARRHGPSPQVVLELSAAAEVGLQAGDRIVAINGQPVAASDIPDVISGSEGAPLRVTVVRNGERVVLGPVAAREADDGVYRLGFGLEARRPRPGRSRRASVRGHRDRHEGDRARVGAPRHR